MARRPLVATVVTTVIGSVLGAGLGAGVGRVIALFGDQTVETSLPMVFCGTIGYFVGGASAAKGSLDRFGAQRTALGTTVATLILIGLVGGASLSRSAGLVVFVVGLVGAALAGFAASAVGAPRSEPVVRGQRPRPVAAPPKEAGAARQEVVEAEFLETPEPTPSVAVKKPAIRKVPVNPAPAPEADSNWSLDDEPPAPPPAPQPPTPRPPASRPRRDRPLRKGDA